MPNAIFEAELRRLINQHSQENGSNTPDRILAEYMNRCLDAFNAATKARDQWYFQTQVGILNTEPTTVSVWNAKRQETVDVDAVIVKPYDYEKEREKQLRAEEKARKGVHGH